MGNGGYRPTAQAEAFKKEVIEQINQQLSQLRMVKEQDIPALNKLIRDKGVDAITLPKAPAQAVPGAM